MLLHRQPAVSSSMYNPHSQASAGYNRSPYVDGGDGHDGHEGLDWHGLGQRYNKQNSLVWRQWHSDEDAEGEQGLLDHGSAQQLSRADRDDMSQPNTPHPGNNNAGSGGGSTTGRGVYRRSQESAKRNAEFARANRQRKKEYVTTLEEKVRAQNDTIKQLRQQLEGVHDETQALKDQVSYLQNVIANQSSLSNVLTAISMALPTAVLGSPSTRSNQSALSPSMQSGNMNNPGTKRQGEDGGEQGARTMKQQRLSDGAQRLPSGAQGRWEEGGGVCLHVTGAGVSMEFCHQCSRSAQRARKPSSELTNTAANQHHVQGADEQRGDLGVPLYWRRNIGPNQGHERAERESNNFKQGGGNGMLPPTGGRGGQFWEDGGVSNGGRKQQGGMGRGAGGGRGRWKMRNHPWHAHCKQTPSDSGSESVE